MEGAAAATGELNRTGDRPIMKTKSIFYAMAMALAVINAAQAQAPTGNAVPVTVENFTRAESDKYFGGLLKDSGGIGKVRASARSGTH